MKTDQLPPSTAIIILAAGASSRFKGCKVLTPIDGKPLLQIAIEKAQRIFDQDVYVVVGGWQKAIEEARQKGDIQHTNWIDSPDWEKGLGHSIAAAVQQLQHHYQRLMIVAADQVALTHDDLIAILERADNTHIVAAHYAGSPGIPALFPAIFFKQLLALSGDRGAKRVLIENSDCVVTSECPRAAIDIDCPEDLEHWLISTEQRLHR